MVTESLDSLGDSITTAVIVSWAKEPGDAIKEDDVIAVVETDKVTMDIRAKKSGVFVEGLVKAAAEISVGAPLYRMDTSATAPAVAHSEATVTKEIPAAEPAAASASSSAAAAEIMVPVPAMGESITTGVLANWTVKAGDSVAADQVIGTIDTDKVSVDVRAPQQGIIAKIFSAEGDEINVGAPLFTFVPGSGSAATESKKSAAAVPVAKEAVKPSPATSSAAPAKTEAKPAAKAAATPAEPPVTALAGSRTEKRVKLTRMRQRIAVRLKEAQNTAAMLTTFQEVDMTNLITLRNTHKEEFEKIHGVKLGFMSAFVRATTVSLQEIPAVNAVIDDATQEIVYRNYVDVSVAVASPKGLVVPVLRNTETMSFAVR